MNVQLRGMVTLPLTADILPIPHRLSLILAVTIRTFILPAVCSLRVVHRLL